MTTKSNDFNQIIKGRRSIRKYDTTVKIPRDEMAEILITATTAHHQLICNPGALLLLTLLLEKKN